MARRTRVRSALGLYAVLLSAFAFVVLFEAWLSDRPLAELVRTDLTEFDKVQITTFLETNKLLTTLATALIATTTGFLVNRDHRTSLSRGDFRRAIASWTAAALSLYFGHLSHQQMLWMLHSRFFNIFYDAVWYPSRLQFWLFLLASILLADFIYRSVHKGARDAAIT